MSKDKINEIHIGRYTVIENEYKDMGDGVWIGSFVTIRPKVKIGRRTDIRNYCFLAEGCIIGSDTKIFQYSNIGSLCEVGNKVFIGAKCLLLNDKKIDYLRRQFEPMPVKVGNGARIGSGSIIMPSVMVGENALVGAGSVVTKYVPPGEIWMGVPAKKKGEVPPDEYV